jgi:hypothetical protein
MFSFLGKYPYILVLEFTHCSLENLSFWLLKDVLHMVVVILYNQDVFR